MSEDRLKEIKQFQVSGDTAWAWRWLISEVERLRGQLKDAYKLYEVKADQIIREKKKDATIATLLALLRKYEWHEGCGCKFGSRGEREANPECEIDKALATAQEDRGE